MKIAIYHNHYNKSSGEDVMFDLECKALTERGHEILPVQMHIKDVLEKNSKLDLAITGFRAPDNPDSFKMARKVIQLFKPDLVHVHNWFPMLSPSIYRAHFIENIPVVQTLHNYRLGCAGGNFRYQNEACDACLTKNRTQAVLRRCYQNSYAGSYFWKRTIDKNFKNGNFLHSLLHYICPSREVFKRHLKIGIPPEKMTIVPNACNDPIQGGEIPPMKKIRVTYLGRLVPEKGVETLIHAWKMIRNNFDKTDSRFSAELCIVGEGSSLGKLKDQASDTDGVHFKGYLPHHEALEIIRNSSTVVFPSLWGEPFGLGVIEGMAAGCAVVASDIGGPSEIVKHNETGLLFKAGDSHALRDCLLDLFRHPGRVLEMGKNARKVYLEKYQPSVHALLLEELYKRSLAEL